MTHVLDDRPIAVKVGLAVCTALLTAAGVGGVAIHRVGELHDRAESIRSEGLVPVRATETLRRAFLQTRVDALADEFIAADDSSPEHQAFLADLEAVDAASAELREVATTPEQLAALDGFEAAWATYVDVVGGELLALARADQLAAYTQLRTDVVKPVAADVQGSLDALVEATSANADASVRAAADAAGDARAAVLALLAAGLALAVALSVLVTRRITRSLRELDVVVSAVAAGDLTVRTSTTAGDELGRMARGLGEALDSVRASVREVTGSATTLATATEQLRGTTASIAASAEESAEQAGIVSAAAEQVSSNVQTVAAGSEQMGASIREIATNATEAARVATDAVAAAEGANTTVVELGRSSREIGAVVKVITSIAEQTNLLALNATIEAARAGEAGKGFAVVANEVKELAQETARATEDIARRVEAIQGDTGSAVSAIEGITEVIARISDFQQTIASAVEEQTATTNEMGRSVTEAATGSGQIAVGIGQVAAAAQDTTEGVAHARQAVADLAAMSGRLQETVRRFTV